MTFGDLLGTIHSVKHIASTRGKYPSARKVTSAPCPRRERGRMYLIAGTGQHGGECNIFCPAGLSPGRVENACGLGRAGGMAECGFGG